MSCFCSLCFLFNYQKGLFPYPRQKTDKIMEEESVYLKNKSIIKWVLQNSTVLILYTVAKDSCRPERGCQTDSSRVCRVEKYSGQKEKGCRAGHRGGENSRVCIRQRQKWWGLKFIHYQNIKLMPSLLDNVNVRHHSISKHKGTFFFDEESNHK